MSIKELINIASFSKNEKKITMIANATELNEIQEILDVLAVDTIEFRGTITKVINSNKLVLEGEIFARLKQSCARTLEEIATTIEIPVYRIYEKITINKVENKKEKKAKDIVINMDDDEIEVITKDTISLEEVIKEELILEVDPYIKKIEIE